MKQIIDGYSIKSRNNLRSILNFKKIIIHHAHQIYRQGTQISILNPKYILQY